ncbi:MAG TPA: hypothetical protein PLQ44_00155 [Candidatus Paceibacterota bacterium]|nr:hypothetical protein [Candidatus Paceibacterota bacterium]HPT40013.1 hypothetical protein [Candidatus Paceibacterota bacterium]
MELSVILGVVILSILFGVLINRSGRRLMKYYVWGNCLAVPCHKISIYCKFFWYSLWIRKDEFHKSLRLDLETILYGSKKFKQKYMKSLNRRRKIAHERDTERRAKK